MFKRVAMALSLGVLAACSPPTAGSDGASAGPAEAAAQTPGGAPAGAEAAIMSWARSQFGETNVFEPVDIFYGDFTGDGAPDALAWVLYSGGGNSALLDVALFRNQGGRMTYYRSAADVYGGEPRDVVFANGRITLTSTMPRPGDARCCPTGSENWTIETD
ncbi:MAG: hypothetical protein H7124_15990 [Phycisphaerales bacterium]|nr:hypothetical protein [Hyphomonadaceae bacterium]